METNIDKLQRNIYCGHCVSESRQKSHKSRCIQDEEIRNVSVVFSSDLESDLHQGHFGQAGDADVEVAWGQRPEPSFMHKLVSVELFLDEKPLYDQSPSRITVPSLSVPLPG